MTDFCIFFGKLRGTTGCLVATLQVVYFKYTVPNDGNTSFLSGGNSNDKPFHCSSSVSLMFERLIAIKMNSRYLVCFIYQFLKHKTDVKPSTLDIYQNAKTRFYEEFSRTEPIDKITPDRLLTALAGDFVLQEVFACVVSL